MAGSIATVTNSIAGVRRRPADYSAGTGRTVVIAVDGPSGSGKSSAARGAAADLGLRYLDTGAMYRAATWWLLEHDVDLAGTDSVIGYVRGLTIDISTDPGRQHVRVDGIDVTAEIRNRRVSSVVSLVASIPAVRSQLIGLQRQIISEAVAVAGGIVAEGRDVGTVVAPDADVKIFLTASEQARAARRTAELAGHQVTVAAEVTRHEQAQRDQRDAPQTQVASDAVRIDATELGLSDVIACIVGLATSKRADA